MDHRETHYTVLEISETATSSEIKKAYRVLASEYHPDKVPDHLSKLKKDATDRFLRIKLAYDILSHEASRRRYDSMLRGGSVPGRPPTATGGKASSSPQPEGKPHDNPMSHPPAFMVSGKHYIYVACFAICFGAVLVRCTSREQVIQPREFTSRSQSESADNADLKKDASRHAIIKAIPDTIVGTWRLEGIDRWICIYADGRADIIDSGEDVSGISWNTQNDKIVFVYPDGSAASFVVTYISSNSFAVVNDKDRNNYIGKNYRSSWGDTGYSAIRLDSSSSELERNTSQREARRRVNTILPGIWRRGNETWHIFSDGRCDVFRKFAYSSTADSYTWKATEGEMIITEPRFPNGRGDPHEDIYTLLGVWSNYIGTGLRSGSFAVAFDSYEEMIRVGTIDDLHSVVKGSVDIDALPRQLVGVWRGRESTMDINADGTCVISKMNHPRHYARWSYSGDSLVIDGTQYRIYEISDSILRIADRSSRSRYIALSDYSRVK